MKHFRLFFAAGLIGLAVAASGCGIDSLTGSDDDEGGTSSTSSTSSSTAAAAFRAQFFDKTSDSAEPVDLDQVDLSTLPEDDTIFDSLFQ